MGPRLRLVKLDAPWRYGVSPAGTVVPQRESGRAQRELPRPVVSTSWKGTDVSNISTADRFWRKVIRRGPDDCWLWTAEHNRDGYGKIKIDGKNVRAHRYSYFLATGVEPGHLFVCHTCDVRDCVNPAHLFLGTNNDNMADMTAKGRGDRRGELNGQAKLTDYEARQVQYLRLGGLTVKEVADRFGICEATVTKVCAGERYIDGVRSVVA